MKWSGGDDNDNDDDDDNDNDDGFHLLVTPSLRLLHRVQSSHVTWEYCLCAEVLIIYLPCYHELQLIGWSTSTKKSKTFVQEKVKDSRPVKYVGYIKTQFAHASWRNPQWNMADGWTRESWKPPQMQTSVSDMEWADNQEHLGEHED